MSSYFDNKNELFMEPKTTQYGSNFVMTNVTKPTKTKMVNIDTRFRDSFSSPAVANYNIALPERIMEVKSMRVASVELPISYFNISSTLGNNSFRLTVGTTSRTLIIPDGQYTPTTLVTAMNNLLGNTDFTGIIEFGQVITTTGITGHFTVTNKDQTNSCTINFCSSIDQTGTLDTKNYMFKLGWILGFRDVIYTIPVSGKITATSPLYLYGPRYLYLAIDDFQNNNSHSFITTSNTSELKQNILGKIVMNPANPFGTLYSANLINGGLLTDKRIYTNRINLQRMNVQLIDEIGRPINLNGEDFSFTLELEWE